MHRLLLVLGALAGTGLTVLGVLTFIDGAQSLSDVRLGETRTRIPGARVAELDGGKYVVFYEVAGESVPEGAEDELPIPVLDIAIRRAGERAALELDDYSADFHVSSGGRAARAAATVELPDDGAYEIAVRGDAVASEPAVVLGKPVTQRLLRLVGGAVGVLAGLGTIALVGVLGVAAAIRRRLPAP